MENVNITIGDVLYFLGLVITAGSAQAVISRWLSPAKRFKKTVDNKVDKSAFDELKAKVDRLEKYQSIDHKELKTVELGNEKICKGILAIMDHELTGNSIEKLRKTKDEIQDYLIEK